jgi:copper resistance protein C
VTHPNLSARLALIAGAALAIMIPAIVVAHAELETSTPADGSTVQSPFDGPIVLRFTEALAEGSEADLLGSDGSTIASADVDQPGATMTFELASDLDPGEYEVRWTGVAQDGHVDRGTFGFSVAAAPPTPEPTPEPTPTATATPSTPAETSPPATVAPSVSPAPSPTVDGGASAGAGDVLLPIIVALLVVGMGGIYLLTRRNRSIQP